MILTKENKEESSQEWIVYELQEVSLGDKRLDWRLLDSAAKLAAQPGASIPQACDDWADTKATVRQSSRRSLSTL